MERLIRARSTSRGWLTRVSETLDRLTSKRDVIDIELSNSLAEFNSRLSNVDDIQGQIEMKIDESLVEETIEEAFTFRQKHLEVKNKAEIKLETLRQEKNSVVDNDNVSDRNRTDSKFGNARLPKLEMQKFSGDYLKFNAFYEKFIAVVDEGDLPAVTKFTYLQSLVTGEALASIKGLSVTAESYPVAKQILTQRFGRKERIIFAHIQKLLTLQVDFRKSNGLWNLYDSLQTHVRCLQTLGVSGETYGVILTPLLLSRIPYEIRMEWAREGEGRESDLDFLLEFLYKEIKRRERSQTFSKEEETRKVKSTSLPSVATFHTNTAHNKSKICSFCNKSGHMSEVCFSIRRFDTEQLLGKVKDLGLCFVCFGKHYSRKCNSKQRCQKCKGLHNSLLCGNNVTSNSMNGQLVKNPHSEQQESNSNSGNVHYAHMEHSKRTTLMQVVATTVASKSGNNVPINVLFDGGSDRSFITQNLARKLQLGKCGQESFAFSGFGGTSGGPRTKRNRYSLTIGGTQVDLVEIQSICSEMYRAPVPEEVLRGFDVPFTEDFSIGRPVKVDVLIGLDHYWRLVTCDTKQVNSLVAQRTLCGWMLSGQYTGLRNTNGFQMLCTELIPEHLVRGLWELDNIGITDEVPLSMEGDTVMSKFEENVSFEGGRYCVGLPWKEHMKDKLLNNKKLAEKRLTSLSRRLEAKPELKAQYNENLRDMESTGVIHEVLPTGDSTGPVFYMPHRPVVKEGSKTTKVRPVFDASAKGYNGVSLNDCLETGPNLLPNLVEVLLRFRRWLVAVTADVTKAFLQVKVRNEDKDALRFLWDDGGKVRSMVFDRVPFGTKASPFLLNATIKHHLGKYNGTNTVSELKDNLYVDDFLSGADTVDEACKLVVEAREILSEAGMTLTKWSSNSVRVADSVLKEFDPRFDAVETTKVLGLKWIPSEDYFSYNAIEIPDNLVITKRVVLSFIARLFDPLGFLTPFAITAKILFQELWELGNDWDVELPESLSRVFAKWLKELNHLENWKIPRCFSSFPWLDGSDLEIHIFGDASEKAYGCCAYLRITRENEVQISLLMSKARVAPLKRITLPRLELLAALLGARMKHFVQTSLHLPANVKYTCHTDSKITLYWIQSDSNRWKMFVANRVREIQDLTDPSCWRHCVGTQNPADLLTRGVSVKTLMSSSLWLHGPDWLSRPPGAAPPPTSFEVGSVDLTGEERQANQSVSIVSPSKMSVLKLERYSSMLRAVRIMGWIQRFLNKCRKKVHAKENDLSSDEQRIATHKLLQITQEEFYQEEMKSLKDNGKISKSSSLRKLSPFIGEDGLLRARCRLNYSDLAYNEKYPVIIPKCQFSLLLVREAHATFKHAGVNQMISHLRNLYWIVGLRSLARKVKSACLGCKRLDAKACQEPMAPLMEARIKQAPPFSTTGTDYAGPVYCKDFPQKKFYILLFTCAVIRAVHLELVPSLSVPNFLLAFKRFVARRGIPSTVYSDNAQTFRSASTALFKIYGSNAPTWRFSVPRAPWWGGWWERMIKNVKGSLKKTVGNRCLERIELETTLVEVEACLNSRPLTFVGDDIENGHPLSPSHFLLGRGSHLTRVSDQTPLPINAKALKEHVNIVDARLMMFWHRWQDEYLRQLPFPKSRGKVGKVQIGSVVLVREDCCPRLYWPMGVIEELIKGRDGIVRTVKVKTKTGSFTRPIQRIHDLELHRADDTALDHPVTGEVEPTTRSGRVVTAPTRYTAGFS